ncbi:MAG TPA: D-alanyl-D-alanine endopeptidase [Steroidobacteraceae bacterium]|nr:D-alanyl-D-alanine endopeptidase [Steroidobacteraceae bacterium]
MGSGFLSKLTLGHGKRSRLASLVWACSLLAASAACAAAPIHLASVSRYHHHHRHVYRHHLTSSSHPNLRSSEALVLDVTDHKVLYARKPDDRVPIASISKLMTTLVVAEAKQPLDEQLQVTSADRAIGIGAYSRLAVGTRLTRAQLFHLALMASENRAAHALARNYPGGVAACISAMNAKAHALGMTHTHFVEPTGLSSDNTSTPDDLAKLVMAASQSPVIRLYSTSRGYTIRSGRRMVAYHNTDALVDRRSWHIVVQKTGFTNAAGHCLVMQAVIDHRTVVIVLLNSWGRYTRVADARRVRQWTEAQLTRRAVRQQVASRA